VRGGVRIDPSSNIDVFQQSERPATTGGVAAQRTSPALEIDPTNRSHAHDHKTRSFRQAEASPPGGIRETCPLRQPS
jgi:hypothetical protein